jgi:Chagasin family peptidase inhibitor I42
VQLRVGEHYKTRLPGRGGAGYVWEYALAAGDREAVAVSLDRAAPNEGAPQTGAPPPAASVDTVVDIHAVRRGVVQLILRSVRPWETGGHPLEERILNVRVTG